MLTWSNRLVIETLEPLPTDRKCFRMVNGVLVERTIQDVLPSLKTNSDGLKQVLEEMLKQYKSKQAELDSWKVYLRFTYCRVRSCRLMLMFSSYRQRTIYKLCSHKTVIPRPRSDHASVMFGHRRMTLAFTGNKNKLDV